jgi:Phytanoyl-CoA dioxygenase (PhyH)
MFRLKRGPSVDEPLPEGRDELFAEIEDLTAANRKRPARRIERRLLNLRHAAGIQVLDTSPGAADYVKPAFERLPEGDPLPEIAGADVTPELVRAGILRDGCLLVRGLVDREEAERFAKVIDRTFAARDKSVDGARHDGGYYEEFRPDERFEQLIGRPWLRRGGGVLAADSPVGSFEMLELLGRAGVTGLVESYLGEAPLISVQKCTLRKADPAVPGAWHQDGYFLGDVRSLNLWLSLSHCGDDAPGLDIVPRRLEELVPTGDEGPGRELVVAHDTAVATAGDTPIMRPTFEPGDALFFDELFLHQTGVEPTMPKPRFALESWFFGSSAFPGDYAPLAI